eukprot:104874-Rhodomonas_salina.1
MHFARPLSSSAQALRVLGLAFMASVFLASTVSAVSPVQIEAGGYHACARFEDGTLKCWGFNSDGQLGLGDTEHRGDEAGEMGNALPFVDLGQGRTVTQVCCAVKGDFSCALLDDST